MKLVVVLLALASTLPAQTSPAVRIDAKLALVPSQTGNHPDPSQTVREFVQGFYDWYVPRALGNNSSPAWAIAVKAKPSFFNPELALKLRQDATAQAKAKGEIVGLDFDPFLNDQDPAKHYVVGKVVRVNTSYRVEIHRVSSDKPDEEIAVTAQVMESSGHAYFANFHYPDGQNLLNLLGTLAKDRRSIHK